MVSRRLPVQVREEMARCFDLVRRLGRGAVYLGSSRVPPTHPHFLQTAELAREASTTTRDHFLAVSSLVTQNMLLASAVNQ